MYINPPSSTSEDLSEYLVRQFSYLHESILTASKPFYTVVLPKNPQDSRLYNFPVKVDKYDAGVYIYKKDSNEYYRVQDSSVTLQLGVLHTQAFYGDLGQIAYEHSNTIGNPHQTSRTDIGLGNVDNTADKDKPVSNAVIAELNKYVLKTTTINRKPLTSNIVLTADNIEPTLTRRYVTWEQYQRVDTPASATTDGYLTAVDWNTFNKKEDNHTLKAYFADLSPIKIASIKAGVFIFTVMVDVIEAFDGTGTVVTVGTMGNPTKYVSMTDIDISTVVNNVVTVSKEALSDEDIMLFLTPGTLETAGIVVVKIITG
jgi:hypothetical protein